MTIKRTFTAIVTAAALLTSTVAPSLAGIYAPFDTYNNATDLRCTGDGGPAGETPGCRPPPYRPQTCVGAHVWLPTTILYPVIETVAASDPAVGIAASGNALGNYIAVTVNPVWTLFLYYGVLAQVPYIEEVAAPRLGVHHTYNDRSWPRTRGKGNILLPTDIYGTPKVFDGDISNRMWSAGYTAFIHALPELVSNPSRYQFSYSPWAKTSISTVPSNYTSLSDYRDVMRVQATGPVMTAFLNRSNPGIVDEFTNLVTNGSFVNSVIRAAADPEHLVYKDRPIYFLYAKYYISIHKGQADGINRRCRS